MPAARPTPIYAKESSPVFPAEYAVVAAVSCRRGENTALVELAAARVDPSGGLGTRLSVVIRDGGPIDDATRRRMLLTDGELARGVPRREASAQLADLAGDLPAFIFSEDDRVTTTLHDELTASGSRAELFDLAHLGAFVVPGRFRPTLREVAQALLLDPPLMRRAKQEVDVLAQAMPALLTTVDALPVSLLLECRDAAHLLSWPLAPGFREAVENAVSDVGGATVLTDRLRGVLCSAFEASRPERPTQPRPSDADIDRILGPKGAVSRHHPGYEHRPEQITMGKDVAGALCRDEILLAEAGTGVGKSLAYLIPSILFATATGERVAISTATRNLQDQLSRKDVPFLQDVLDIPFKATVIKGRENYICVRKLADTYGRLRGSMFDADRIAALKLLAWAALSEARDLTELGMEEREFLKGSALEVRSEEGPLEAMSSTAQHATLRSQTETCHRRACTFTQGCAIERLRRRASASDLLIINHALLFSTGPGVWVLPNFARIVLDEAHQIEDICTEHLGLAFSCRELDRVLGHLARQGDREAIFSRIGEAVSRSPDVLGGQLDTRRHAEVLEMATRVEALRQALGEMGPMWCFELCGNAQASRLRLRPESFSGEMGARVSEAAFDMVEALRLLVEGLRVVSAGFEGKEQLDVVDPQTYANELAGVADTLEEIARALEVIVAQEDEGWVYWLNVGRGDVSLHAAPIDVGPLLADALHRPMRTVVLTSATLTVEGRTEYIRQRLGVDLADKGRVAERVLPSSFDFRSQALLAIPTDAPLPNDDGWQDYAAEAIRDLLTASRGRGLVLFTARAMMDRTFDLCAGPLRAAGIPVQCQYRHGSRAELQRELIENRDSVLFATRSFFEGVDIPGDALECVIITKLPFGVPSDPLIEARCEALQREGLDPMNEYYIPQAIMIFRQAFGRLIRSRRDRGVIAVLDRRLLQRHYGRRFLSSIPECARSMKATAAMIASVREFLRD